MRCLPNPPGRLEPSRAPIEAPVLHAWLWQARAGEGLEHHQGFLAIDRGRFAGRGSMRTGAALERLAETACSLVAAGRVHLLQRRLAPEHFGYLAVACPPARPGTSR